MPIHYAHQPDRAASLEVRKSKELDFPGCGQTRKSQVTVRIRRRENPSASITAVVISTQHDPSVVGKTGQDEVLAEIKREIVETVHPRRSSPKALLDDKTIKYFTSTRPDAFVIGGPHG